MFFCISIFSDKKAVILQCATIKLKVMHVSVLIIHFPQEYKQVIDQQSPHILLDVREPVELEICSLPTESLSILHLQVFSFFNDNIVIIKIDIWLSYPTKLVQRVNNWNQPIRSPHCWSIMLLVLDLALLSQMILQHNSTWRSLGSFSHVIIKYLVDQAYLRPHGWNISPQSLCPSIALVLG